MPSGRVSGGGDTRGICQGGRWWFGAWIGRGVWSLPRLPSWQEGIALPRLSPPKICYNSNDLFFTQPFYTAFSHTPRLSHRPTTHTRVQHTQQSLSAYTASTSLKMGQFAVFALVLLASLGPADAQPMAQSMMPIGDQPRDQPIPNQLLPFGHTAIVAPTNSGKTTFILNFFINPAILTMYLSYYHYIIIVSSQAVPNCNTGYELMMARNHHGK